MAKKVLIILFVISLWMLPTSAFSDNVTTLLEKGIYAEETKGDLDEAISIYKKIVDANTDNSSNIAEAYYRLGTCYLKTGDESKAIEMFKELLIDFRDHKEIASDARAQLSKLNALDEEDQINKPLELGPVPWKAGETSQYNVKTPVSSSSAKFIRSVKEINKGGNDLWRIEFYYATPAITNYLYARADVLKESLSPVSAIMRRNIGGIMSYDYEAIYKKDHIRFTNNAKENTDIPVEDIVYDWTQRWEIIRRLPLAENYSTSYSTFVLESGGIINGQLTVTGRETVTVPAGTFECYRLKEDYNPTRKIKMWVSADDKKYIVKIEEQGNVLELEKVSNAEVEKPAEYYNSEFGISMTAPKGWHFIKSAKSALFNMRFEILSPELKSVSGGVVVPAVGVGGDLSFIRQATIPALKQMFKNFTPRPETWKYGEIDGLPSLKYIADYDNEDKKMIEYRTYILNKQGFLFTFCLRVEKETYDEIKIDIDRIVQSFKWDK